jgi:PLP dependent protein
MPGGSRIKGWFLYGGLCYSTAMSIAENYRRIQDEIKELLHSCGRDQGSVKIMAVSKTKPYSAVLEAYEAGIRLFGENRVAEGVEKFTRLEQELRQRNNNDKAVVHLIGHLQRNKAGKAVYFNCVQSIDKKGTASALAKSLTNTNTESIDVYLEANTSGESSKSGVHSYDELRKLSDDLLAMSGINIRGLMTIAPFVDDEKAIRKSFSDLRNMSEKLLSEYKQISALELSMGMSDDFRYAVLEGSTLIRLGTVLFGKRDYNI